MRDVPQHDYLFALADARRLFSAGCKGIHHMQLVAYYRALVSADKDQIKLVLPDMPAKWYKRFISGEDQEDPQERLLQLVQGHNGLLPVFSLVINLECSCC